MESAGGATQNQLTTLSAPQETSTMSDRRPPEEKIKALLDLAGELIERIFGPEDDLAEICIDARTLSMRIITDHGARLTIDQQPSVN